jgi:carotenoid 1,2-hydratase
VLSLGGLDVNHVQSALVAPGGFAWWYADVVAPGGAGAVLLWSFGLPFLPDARQRPVARARAALSLALYEAGRPSFYLLQEHEDADWEGGRWRFGRSEIAVDESASRVQLRARLDLDLPAGDRLRGTLALDGPRFEMPSRGAGSHRWTPIAPHARAALDLGGRRVIAGRGYFDANASTEALDALGIADWRWGRVAFPDHELVYFVCVSEREAERVHLALRVERDGATRLHEGVDASWIGERRAVYGLKHHRSLRLTSADGLEVEIDHRHLVDDGPFYLRFLTEGRDCRAGVTGLGSAERVVPNRVDLGWQRPFVRMRRHRLAGDNSIWLPLFSGPRRGRLGRLMRHWWQEGA